MYEALLKQSDSCLWLGSPMYHELFVALSDDYRVGGITADLLTGVSSRPVHDAVALRIAGAVHRLVLSGKVPSLARHYPSVGGDPTASFVIDFLAVLKSHTEQIRAELRQPVQTNEIGRSVALLTAVHWLPSIDVSEFRLLELGASAGLNMCFDRYGLQVADRVLGDSTSAVMLSRDYVRRAPTLAVKPAKCVERYGVDISPIDLNDSIQVSRLMSFVWPDQAARFGRLANAIEIARDVSPRVDRGSADHWLASMLQVIKPNPTVVFHSIVWQYLDLDVREGVCGTSGCRKSCVDKCAAGVVADGTRRRCV